MVNQLIYFLIDQLVEEENVLVLKYFFYQTIKSNSKEYNNK